MSEQSNQLSLHLQILSDEINLVIMEYLFCHGYIKTLRSFEKETGLTPWNLDSHFQFLRILILDGRWNDLEIFLSPLGKISSFPYNDILFSIYSQIFLEMVFDQISFNITECNILINKLIALSEPNSVILSSYLNLLSLPSLTSHPSYHNWTIHKGRLECFEKILSLLGETKHDLVGIHNDRLLSLIKQSLLYQLSSLSKDSFNDTFNLPTTFTFPLIRDINIDDIKVTKQVIDSPKSHLQLQTSPIPLPSSSYTPNLSFYCQSNFVEHQPLRCLDVTLSSNIAFGSNSRSLYISDFITCDDNNSESKPSTLSILYKKTNYHVGSLFCVKWNHDNTLLASGSNDKTIKILPMPYILDKTISSFIVSHDPLILCGHEGTIRDILFTPSSSHLISCGGSSTDHSVRYWDINNRICLNKCQGHADQVFALVSNNEGKIVYSTSLDGQIIAWDINNSIPIKKFQPIVSVSISSICLDEQRSLFFLSYSDGRVICFDLKNSKTLWSSSVHHDDCRSIDLSIDKQLLLSCSFDHSWHILSTLNGESILHNPVAHNNKITQIKWHPSYRSFITTSADHSLKVWKIKNFSS